MEQKSGNGASAGRSSLLNAEENVAGAAVGAVTLAASFIPFISYISWCIPMVCALSERKSKFARLCDIQLMSCSLVTCVCSLLTLAISPFAQSAMEAAAGSRMLLFGSLGIVMSLLRVVCLAFEILIAYNAFKHKTFEVPGVTGLIKKAIKYSDK